MSDRKLKNNNWDIETEVLVVNGNPILSKALDICQSKKANLHFLKENVLTTETFEALESDEVNLVIVDVSVDDKNDINMMTDQLRNEYPTKPIIILSIEDEKKGSSKTETAAEECNPTVQKVSSEIIQALDYADSLLKCHIYGFIISLNI